MKSVSVAVAAALMMSFSVAMAPGAALAQCAGCGADRNKADREKTDREAKSQADKADKQSMKESLGNGTAREAAEKAQQHNERNEKALRDVDRN